jgi:hypothetical protein
MLYIKLLVMDSTAGIAGTATVVKRFAYPLGAVICALSYAGRIRTAKNATR